MTDHFEGLPSGLDPINFSLNYFSGLKDLFRKIDPEEIRTFIEILLDARDRDACVFFIGNGGSAATAVHFSNDLTSVSAGGKPFKGISLTGNPAALTAAANDFGYAEIFTRQLIPLFGSSDVLVAISASGNSPNILSAARLALKRGGQVVAITGFDGGELRRIATSGIHVPSAKGEYGPVEDLHMIFDHLVCAYLISYFKKDVISGSENNPGQSSSSKRRKSPIGFRKS